MSASVAILLVALALSVVGFTLKRREEEKIWTAGKAYALDFGVWEFEFSLSFANRDEADLFVSRLHHPSISSRIEPAPRGTRWVVRGTATVPARASWFRAVLAEWTTAHSDIAGTGSMIIATAGKSGTGTAFTLST